MTKIYIF